MTTILAPQFNEFENFKFIGLKEIKIKNNPNTKDYNKVTKALPGMCVGYCPAIYSIGKTKKPIEVVDFYDIRQRGVKKLKGHFITVKS